MIDLDFIRKVKKRTELNFMQKGHLQNYLDDCFIQHKIGNKEYDKLCKKIEKLLTFNKQVALIKVPVDKVKLLS